MFRIGSFPKLLSSRTVKPASCAHMHVYAAIQIMCVLCRSVVDIAISPDSFTDWEHSIQQMVSWAFEPAEEKVCCCHSCVHHRDIAFLPPIEIQQLDSTNLVLSSCRC